MNEDMDVEALQAQIDLSNSISYDIVSSWVKPAASPSTESVSRAMSRELEAFAKRPPRLGLGATVPKSSLATSREAVTLKRKLAPRTRPRDLGSESRAGKPNINDDDEDEDESRSAAISTTKAQINGYRGLGLGNHKKHHGKKKAQHTEANPTTIASVKEVGDEIKKQNNMDVSQDRAASNSFLKPNPFIIPQTAPSQNNQSIMPPPPTTSQPATPSPSKKRRKRGRKKHQSHRIEDDSAATEVEEWTGFSN